MIKIICVGKIKEDFYNKGCLEYLKRLNAFCKLEIIEVKEGNNQDIKKTMEEEAKNILEKVNKDDFIVTLEIEGKKFDSVSFAKKIDELFTYGKTNIVFIIGGSFGLSDSVKNKSNLALSFSNFTFPHQLMRLILVEQIYRAFTILKNKEYHK